MMPLSKEDAKRLSEAAAKAGVSMREAAAALMAFVRSTAEAVGVLVRAAAKYVYPTDEMLESVATGKEWHLMKHAKKYRTRKKYRNRLAKRLEKENNRKRSNEI